jgi:hypothetical protein
MFFAFREPRIPAKNSTGKKRCGDTNYPFIRISRRDSIQITRFFHLFKDKIARDNNFLFGVPGLLRPHFN